MIRFIITLPLTLALMFWLLYNVCKALRTGIANAAGVKHRKEEEPLWYDFTIVVQVLFSAVFFGVSVKLAKELVKYWL